MIAFFNSNKAWGGGEKWHFQMACEMQNDGIDCVLFTHPESELYKRAIKGNIKSIAIRISNFSFINPFKILKLIRLFKINKIQSLVLNLSSDVKAASIAARLANINKIIYRRGMALPVSNSFINRYLFKKAIHYVVVNSKDIGNKLNSNNPKLVDKSKIKLIYNGVKISEYPYNKITGDSHTNIILTNVGRLVEQKGQKYLIEVARLLKNDFSDFIIKIAGTGKLEYDLKQLVIKNKVEDKIEFIGFQKDIKQLLSMTDIFVFPSLNEGSANVLIEAMAMGKPIIAFNVSSMPEMIENKKNGFLIEFDNVCAFAEKTLELIKNRDLRIKFGNESRRIAEEKFSYEKMKNEFIQLINH